MESDPNLNFGARKFTDTVIRLALFALLALLCWWIVTPFISLIVWGLVLAVALYPLHQGLARKLGRKQGRASTLMVLGTVLLIGTPMAFLAVAVVNDIHTAITVVEAGSLEIPLPNESVAEWPVVGEKVYDAWNAAATNLDEFQTTYAPQLKALSKKAVETGLGVLGATFLFFAAMVVAGIMMAFGKEGTQAMAQIARRLAGQAMGDEFHTLSVATVRSVATGVIGVACIQALLFGIIFLISGVPLPGLLALLVLVAGIMQLPALIFALPAIAYLWMGGDGSTVFNVVMTVCFLVAGVVDNVLKPMLLGRGVKAPMPVILIGALGGMVVSGLIGLFLGAVLLAVCYQAFMGWVGLSEAGYEASDAGSETVAPTAE